MANNAGLLVSYFLSGGQVSGFITTLNLLGIMVLLRHCDVGYPLNVEKFFEVLSTSPNIIPNPFDSISNNDPQYTSTYYNFAKYQDTVNFLDNVGNTLIIAAGCIVAVIVIRAIQFCLRRDVTK